MHLGGELFKLSAGIDLLHVPFKGGGPAHDRCGRRPHASCIFATIPTATPHVRSGKIRALGVGSAKRQSVLPDVPTVSEAGLPGYEVENWVGIVAPAGTPQTIVDKLNKEISAILDFAGVSEAAHRSRARSSMRMSTGRVRRLHGEGAGQMGTRREGGRHQGAMI